MNRTTTPNDAPLAAETYVRGLAAVALAAALAISVSPAVLWATADRTEATPTETASDNHAKRSPEAPVELIYSVNRTPESTFDTPRSVEVISAEDIRRKNARTVPEVLMEEGVFVQQTNYGGGSPIMRGLVGKQILLLVDGVRLNNATYRFGPLQYLNTIDLEAVERIEIVRGVGSVLGSDALGGTINVITKKGPLAETGLQSRFFSRYSSADEGVTGRAEVSGRSEKVRYTAGLTYRDSSSVEAGGSVGKQAGTGYDEQGANFHLDRFLPDDRTLSFSFLTLDQNEVPRTDRILSGSNLVFDFEPQRNQLASVNYQDLASRSWTDSLNATLYWNEQEEGRVEIRSSALTTERRLSDKGTTVGFNLELGKFVGESHRLVYGLDFSSDDFDSSRTDVDLVSGATRAKRGRYTDGASYDLLAVYLQDRFDLGERLTLTLGSRYSSFSADGREDSSVGVLDLNSSDESLTGAVSVVVHATPRLNLIANVTRGFRAPNIDDLSIFDERSNGTEVPNPNLQSETIEGLEGGIKYAGDRFSGSAFYYQSDLSDLLVRAAGTIGGLSFFDLDGNGVQDANEPNVLQKQNIGEARVEGFELDWSYRAGSGWNLFGNFTTTTGDDLSTGVPLRRIPPDFGILGARWSKVGNRRPWAEFVYHFASAQRRLNPSDISDSRIGPDGTDGFDVLNLRAGLSITDAFGITAALENLTDQEYKYHSSGLLRPGFQVVVGLEFRP